MKEHIRENYFPVIKILIAFALEIYIVSDTNVVWTPFMLFLFAFFIGSMTFFELTKNPIRLLFWAIEGITLVLLIVIYDSGFIILLTMWILDMVSAKTTKLEWYLPSCILILLPNYTISTHIWITFFLIIIYFQHGAIIHSYQLHLKKDEVLELQLKKNLTQKESFYQEELHKMLEEKIRLSQSLHDKLGHSINGSIYQLEATKVLLTSEPDTCLAMLQAVIDNLRGSMNEIREILRQERPDMHKLALLQLEEICDNCRNMNMDAALTIEGNISDIPDKQLEIILDNTFEAVSNALKYAKCTKIEIHIMVLNKLIRCTIADNGVGCSEIIDGMGLSGMRKRTRSVNGILDFESEIGFTINMLLPIESKG